jgi:transposase InsO family protein
LDVKKRCTDEQIIEFLRKAAIGLTFVAPGSAWLDGLVESFNASLRDELLSRKWFRSRADAKALIERWRQFDNEQRPHSAHRYKAPATVRRAWLEAVSTTPDSLAGWPQDPYADQARSAFAHRTLQLA